MGDEQTVVELLNRGNTAIVEEAKESISRIEETATRIHGIVHSEVKPSQVRTGTRRRNDSKLLMIKQWIVVAVFLSGVATAGGIAFVVYEIQVNNSIALLATRLSGIELQLRRHELSGTTVLLPSQNSATSQ